ncbi:AAA family ATPase [Sinorhizobium alkalisoli]|uniref:AAA family ATPase n=1 Tax=Sinorhizobium alkalisoli TaxID=1752398 RepID=UPI0013F4C46F|nr:AAA family ATPase [Sinorhizobium alkalisoli]MCG5481231.1 AAA family ATPase [Sinorhizobium alkalisoli]
MEFFGLPGIGKTTASRHLALHLQHSGHSVSEAKIAMESRTLLGRQLYRVGLVLPRLFKQDFRSIAARIARFVAQGEQETATDLIRVTWNLWTVAAYIHAERSRSGSITILDQGLLQGFWSVLLKSRQKRTSESWLDILSAIGVEDIIFVDLRGDPDLAQDRLRTRGDRSSRLQRAASGETALWAKADGAYRKMKAEIGEPLVSSACALMLATVDASASASPEQIACRTYEATLLASRRHGPVPPESL